MKVQLDSASGPFSPRALHMRLRMTLEVDTGTGEVMTDWIDDLEKKKRDVLNVAAKKGDLRLHDAQIVRAKAPEFWKATIHFTRHYCSKLAERFPSDRHLHCQVTDNQTTGIRCFSGGPLPNKVIDIDLNLDGQCLDIQEGTCIDRVKSFEEEGPLYHAEFSVGEEEQLRIKFKGKSYESADAFAERLLRYVCNI